MGVGRRWTLSAALGATAWSLPWPVATLGLLFGGTAMTLVMRPVMPRAWRLAWATPLALVILVPVAFVCAGVLFEFVGDGGAFVVAAVIGGLVIGTAHALVFADWERWWWWIVAGAVTGPAIGLVFVSWDVGLPLGFVPGGLYGLATSGAAARALGRTDTAPP